MSETKRIKTALVSVYHKEGLDEIITKLHEEGVEFLSTGGTRQFIESLGYPCKAVEDLTTYPSILITTRRQKKPVTFREGSRKSEKVSEKGD